MEQQTKERDIHEGPYKITDEQWRELIKKLKAWKAAGPDGVRNVWFKRVPSLAKALREVVCSICNGRTHISEAMCEGRTVMIPKKARAKSPSECRPIACLNTIYKALTTILATELMEHMTTHEILPQDQRALRKTQGTFDLLKRDEAVLIDAKSRGKELNVTWLDFTKAIDSVAHKWLKECINVIGMPKWWNKTFASIMSKWATRLQVRQAGETHISNRGVVRGDSLSPALFALAIVPVSCVPVSWALDQTPGYTCANNIKVTHGVFVDDIKLYAKHPENQRWNSHSCTTD